MGSPPVSGAKVTGVYPHVYCSYRNTVNVSGFLSSFFFFFILFIEIGSPIAQAGLELTM